VVGVLVMAIAAGLFFFRSRSVAEHAPLQNLAFEVLSPNSVRMHEAPVRTTDSYRGLGAWVDGFDYSPAYSSTGVPPLGPSDVDDMALAVTRHCGNFQHLASVAAVFANGWLQALSERCGV